MPDQALRANTLRKLSAEQINNLVAEQQIPLHPDASREEKISALVLNSYPIRDLPKFRESSIRGLTFSALVFPDGRPTMGATKDEVVEMIMCTGKVLNVDSAVREWEDAQWKLVRYFGYLVATDPETGRVTVSKRTRYPVLVDSDDDDEYFEDEVEETEATEESFSPEEAPDDTELEEETVEAVSPSVHHVPQRVSY
jgi:hypothetical protein